jgi:hypothetical protein
MTKWQVRRIHVDDVLWGRLLSEVKHLVFHEPVWARVTEAGLDGESYCLLLEKDGEAVGGILGFARRMLGIKLLYMNVPYGGVIGEGPADEEFAHLLSDFARREGIAQVRLINTPGVTMMPTVGFQLSADATYLLHLKDQTYDQLWTAFKPAIRRDVRKAERCGITVEDAPGLAGVEAFYALYLEAMHRNRAIPKYGQEFIMAVYQHLVVSGAGALLLAYLDGQPIAGILVVDSPRMSHYLLGGSRSATLKYCPNDLLLHVAIKRAAEKGLHTFDFLPSGVNNPALARFKSKWNAQPVTAHTLTLATRPLAMRLWHAAYWLAATRPGRWLLQQYRCKGTPLHCHNHGRQ